jgi:hypothetical protein
MYLSHSIFKILISGSSDGLDGSRWECRKCIGLHIYGVMTPCKYLLGPNSWKDNIRTILWLAGFEDVKWIELVQERIPWLAWLKLQALPGS